MNNLETILMKTNEQGLAEVTIQIPDKNRNMEDLDQMEETAKRFGYDCFHATRHALFRRPIITLPGYKAFERALDREAEEARTTTTTTNPVTP